MKDNPVILVVDDQLQNNALLEAYLAPQGYEVIKTISGEKALETLSRTKIDLVLLDIMMPKMSGLEVLEKLRADEKTRRIPVVMVTALRETEDKIRALEAGCDDFISKPVDKIELLARVKSILKISHYLRQLDESNTFKAVVDKISDGIAICSQDYWIKDSNEAAKKYLNIVEPDTANMVEVLFQDYSVSMNKEAVMDLAIGHKAFDIVRAETETTKVLYLEVSVDMIKDALGGLLSIVFIFRDVTMARKEELIKQEWLTLISHKLSAPLGVISGNITLLRDGSYGLCNEEQEKALNATLKQTTLLIAMVEKQLGQSIVCGHFS